jgi:hypothetical protein
MYIIQLLVTLVKEMGTICRQTPIEEIQKELAKQNVRFDY